MSYILEALKKAQAERQLGETPTIHAPSFDGAPAQADGAPLRKPLVLALVAAGVVIAGLAAVVWRQAAQHPVAPAAPAQAVVQPPVQAVAQRPLQQVPVPRAPVQQMPATAEALPAVAATPLPPSSPAPVGASETAPVSASAARTAPVPPVVVATIPPAAPAKAPRAAEPMPAPAVSLPPAHSPAPAPVRAAPPPAPAPAAAPPQATPAEEPVQALRDLPEPIRRAIPAIAMGGYMYSPNPADRLVLIDKVLRREGDEVAPGLVLARLEPKSAVFTFRGYRYRVPY